MTNVAQSLAADAQSVRPVGETDEADAATPELRAEDVHPSREAVAREAYRIYIANGSQDGSAEDDWLAAERRLTGRSERRQTDATQEQAAAQLEEANATVRTPG